MTIFLIRKNNGKIVRAVSEMPNPLPGNLLAIDDAINPPPVDGGQTWDGAKWSDPPPAPALPLDAEELYDVLKIKGVLADGDRPRPKPRRA